MALVRGGSTREASTYRAVNDRHEETKRLAGTGSRRNHEALSGGGLCDRLGLMPIEFESLAADPEDASGFGAQCAVRNQMVDARAAFKVRIDRDKGFRPKTAARVDRVDLFPEVLRAYLSEGPRELFVVGDQSPIEVKDVHAGLPSCSIWLLAALTRLEKARPVRVAARQKGEIKLLNWVIGYFIDPPA